MDENVSPADLLQEDALDTMVEEAGEVEGQARLGKGEDEAEGVVLNDIEAAVPKNSQASEKYWQRNHYRYYRNDPSISYTPYQPSTESASQHKTQSRDNGVSY